MGRVLRASEVPMSTTIGNGIGGMVPVGDVSVVLWVPKLETAPQQA